VQAIGHLFSSLLARPESKEEEARWRARQAEVIEKLASAIIARRLEAPAVLFLELNRPLGFIFSQAAFFARPFLAFFMPAGDVEAAAELLDDPTAIDRLVDRIGDLSSQREN